jgi:hypothetical protein
MTCPHNALGQPACFIVAHPDHPNESFCVTCGRRFAACNSSSESSLTTSNNNHEFLVLAISILILVLLLKAMLPQANQVSPPSYEPPYNYRDMTEVQ